MMPSISWGGIPRPEKLFSVPWRKFIYDVSNLSGNRLANCSPVTRNIRIPIVSIPTRRNAAMTTHSGTLESPSIVIQIAPARTRIRKRSQKINFEAIIGGEEDPRFTAPIETNSGDIENPSPMGLKTQTVSESAEGLVELFSTQKELLDRLFIRANDFLSKNQYIN